MDSYLPVVFFLVASVSTISGKPMDTSMSNGLPVAGSSLKLHFHWGLNDNLGYPPTEIFQTEAEMHGFLQTKVTADFVLVKGDPEALEGKYVEVLTSKTISSNAVNRVCHSYETNPDFCHAQMEGDNTVNIKLFYSIVKEVDGGRVFPIVFSSHQVCSGTGMCSWKTHANEAVVLDKSII